MARPRNDNASPVQESNGEIQKKDSLITSLQSELEEQRRVNEENSRNIAILLKSVDRNKIKDNTPKVKQLPIIKITLLNDRVVDSWSKMTANKVHVTATGMDVEQRSVYHFADTGESIEMEYGDFHSFSQKVDVQTTRVENITDDFGDVIDTWYHFEYEGEEYRINIQFIN